MAAIYFPEVSWRGTTTDAQLAGGSIDTYVAGTSTPVTTYTDSGGLTPAGTTLTLDGYGRANNGNGIWLSSTAAYKFIVKNSAGTAIHTIDNISSGGFNGSSSFITASTETGLTNARVLTTSTTNAIVDAGAGSTIQVQRTALTGDVTASANSNATTIATAAVTLDKMANISTDSLIGRDTAGTGVPEVITLATSLEFSGSGTIRRSALTGDVTASAGSNATTIATGVVTLAKMANIATDKLIGRDTAGTGVPEAIGLGNSLEFDGSGNIRLSTTSVKVPNGTAIAPASAGEIGIDTNSDNVNVTHGTLAFHDGTTVRYIPSTAAYPATNGHVVTFNSGTNSIEWAAAPGFGGGAATSEAFLTIGNSVGLTSERAFAVSNGIAATDGGANASYTINLDVTGLTADATPDGAADYVATYDNSAATNKKVLLNNLPVDITGKTADATPDGAADYVLTYDNSATTNKKVLLNNLPSNIGFAAASGDVFSTCYFPFTRPPQASAQSTLTNQANYVNYLPIMFSKNTTLSAISVVQQAAQSSKTLRLGMYAADTSGAPTGSPLFDSGAISTGAGGTKTYATSQVLTAHVVYYMAFFSDSTTATFSRILASAIPMPVRGMVTTAYSGEDPTFYYRQSAAYGALPTASPSQVTDPTAVVPNIYVTVA